MSRSLSSSGLSLSCVAAILQFDAAQARGGVDQILIELAPVGADLLDLAFERRFRFRRLALLVARRFEFFIALLECVELFGLPFCASRQGAPAPRAAAAAKRDRQ